jgi:signal transduction histidine kinase
MKQSIKRNLLFWYLGSILIITLYFWFGIHIYNLPFATEIFLVLLFFLGLLGFFIINKITDSISFLNKSIRSISSKNLNERVEVNSGDEIEELAKSFNGLLNRLEQSFLRERQFIGDVAHELKTPIATMRTSMEVALSKARSKEEYQYILRESLIDIERLTKTVKDVLDLAWTESLTDRQITKVVSISDLVVELYEIAQKLAIDKQISVTSKIEENLYIYGEREKLARAFLNLIDNAIKYNKPKGKVYLQLKKSGKSAIVIINDTGIGIQNKEIAKIFERFYRGGNSSQREGLGLGLSLAKSIIQVHRGDIKVKSVEGKGTSFTVTLNLVP